MASRAGIEALLEGCVSSRYSKTGFTALVVKSHATFPNADPFINGLVVENCKFPPAWQSSIRSWTACVLSQRRAQDPVFNCQALLYNEATCCLRTGSNWNLHAAISLTSLAAPAFEFTGKPFELKLGSDSPGQKGG